MANQIGMQSMACAVFGSKARNIVTKAKAAIGTAKPKHSSVGASV